MSLHPYHDRAGTLYPELDFRWVSLAVAGVYLGCHRDTVSNRISGGELGKLNDPTSGVRRYLPPQAQRGRIEIRPGVVWMQRKLGRYADPRFDWRQLEGRVSLLHSPMAALADLPPAPPMPVPDPLSDLGRVVAALIQASLPKQQVLEFPGLRVQP
jgi:hypothetical protein